MKLMISGACLVIFCVGIASCGPTPSKKDRKSLQEESLPTPDSLKSKAGSDLKRSIADEPKVTDEISDGKQLDRAKKHASTTFCVEIKPEPQIPLNCVEKFPTPPIVKVEKPCVPEYIPWVHQPPSQIIYLPTGNGQGDLHPQIPNINGLGLPGIPGIGGQPGLGLSGLFGQKPSFIPGINSGIAGGLSIPHLHAPGVHCTCKPTDPFHGNLPSLFPTFQRSAADVSVPNQPQSPQIITQPIQTLPQNSQQVCCIL